MTIATYESNEQAQLSKIKKVGGLLRISTEKTDNLGKKVNLEKTLKNHKAKMLNFLKENKWDYELFEEVVSGGKNVEDRPELKRLIEEVKAAKVDAIVVMELVRLSRQGLSSQIIKEEVKKKGILIITMNPFKIYDMQVPQDAFLYDLSISMGEYERMLTSLRIKQNKISMAHQGLQGTGNVPLGYKRNPATKKLEIIPEEAAIVRQIFDWYIAGEGRRTICEKLNNLGIKNKSGRKWIPNSLKVLLNTETLTGTLIANTYENVKGKMIPTETVIKKENHDAIISPEIWEKAQKIKNLKRERSGIDSKNRDFNSKVNPSILDGLIYCACCQRKSTIKWYAAKNNHYIIKCSKYNASGLTCNNGGMSIKDVEKTVFEKLISYKAEIESKMQNFKSNDFEQRNNELEEEKALLEKQAAKLKLQFKAIRMQEQEYLMNEIEDKDEAEAIAEDKQMNQQQRLLVQAKLEEVTKQLEETPSAETEIEKLQEKIDIIEQLEKRDDLTIKNVNALLKQIILKLNFKRVLPDDSRKYSKTQRDIFPAEIEIEYVH